jgi:hypothetical protein
MRAQARRHDHSTMARCVRLRPRGYVGSWALDRSGGTMVLFVSRTSAGVERNYITPRRDFRPAEPPSVCLCAVAGNAGRRAHTARRCK